jgi:hypothetical protein
MNYSIRVVVEGPGVRSEIEQEFRTDHGMYKSGDLILRNALDSAFGPHVVADDMAESETGF